MTGAEQILNHDPYYILDNVAFVRLVDHMGTDQDIVRAARVSYDADWRAGDSEGSDKRLIGYLMKNAHTSPFEAVQLTVEICCPMFIARQWHRHRTWSYNEVSARYTELDMGYYIPRLEDVGVQSKDNKQVRDRVEMTEAQQDLAMDFVDGLRTQSESAFKEYKYWLEQGVPREIARSLLPMNTYTRFFGSVNLHNMFHFLRLRLHSHTQYEMRMYALALLHICSVIAPVATRAFKDNLRFEVVE